MNKVICNRKRNIYTTVDDDDLEKIADKSIYSVSSGGKQYAFLFDSGKRIYLHRFIIGCGNRQEVDHINGNSLDNRKRNLRLCSRKQNCMNVKLRSDSSFSYKGVSKIKNTSDKIWRAKIGVAGKRISLGCYRTQEEAANAYNEAAIRYFGEFACLNNITGESI